MRHTIRTMVNISTMPLTGITSHMGTPLQLLSRTRHFFSTRRTLRDRVLHQPQRHAATITAANTNATSINFSRRRIRLKILFLRRSHNPRPNMTTTSGTRIDTNINHRQHTQRKSTQHTKLNHRHLIRPRESRKISSNARKFNNSNLIKRGDTFTTRTNQTTIPIQSRRGN